MFNKGCDIIGEVLEVKHMDPAVVIGISVFAVFVLIAVIVTVVVAASVSSVETRDGEGEKE